MMWKSLKSKRFVWFGAVFALLFCGVPALAQDDGMKRFGEVKVETVRPEDLEGSVKIEDPARVIRNSRSVPRLLTSKEMKATRQHVAKHVFEVIALHMPPKPYRQIPMIYRGHAVWLTPKDGGAPQLVSSLDWLERASEIYLVPHGAPTIAEPDDKKDAKKIKNGTSTRTLTLDAMTAGHQQELFEDNKKHYVRVKLVAGDASRNMARLEAPEAHRAKSGLQLFDIEAEPLGRLFGYSHVWPDTLTEAAVLPRDPKNEAIQFYFVTNYAGILGAPMVSQDGRVVLLNALRHPEDAARSLAIPPGAIESFLATQAASMKK